MAFLIIFLFAVINYGIIAWQLFNSLQLQMREQKSFSKNDILLGITITYIKNE